MKELKEVYKTSKHPVIRNDYEVVNGKKVFAGLSVYVGAIGLVPSVTKAEGLLDPVGKDQISIFNFLNNIRGIYSNIDWATLMEMLNNLL